MKFFLALCLLGLANAAFIPLVYNTAGAFPYVTGGFNSPAVRSHAIGILNSPGVSPYTAGVFPYRAGAVPLTYAVPSTIAYTSSVVPAPGYVARTLGSEHIAPLPAGLGYASHHINVAKAPGTN